MKIKSDKNCFKSLPSPLIIIRGTDHYGDVIMDAIASQITSLTIVYSIVYSDADQRKHQSSASLAFVRGIHRGEFPAQMTSYAENVSIWWRHHDQLNESRLSGIFYRIFFDIYNNAAPLENSFLSCVIQNWIQANSQENVVCSMLAIMFRPQCVNKNSCLSTKRYDKNVIRFPVENLQSTEVYWSARGLPALRQIFLWTQQRIFGKDSSKHISFPFRR